MAGYAAGRLVGLIAIMAGKVLGQGALLGCSVVVARVAGPKEFALYSTALTLALLTDACLGSPLDFAVTRFTALHDEDVDRTDRLQAAAFRAKLLIGVCLAVGAAGFARLAARILLHNETRDDLIWIAVGLTSTLLLNRSVATYLQVRLRFGMYSLLDVVQGALRAVVVAMLGFAGANTAVAYLAGLVGAAVALLMISFRFISQPYLVAKWPDRRDALGVFRFLGATTGVIVLGTLTGRTDLLFLAHAAQPDELAKYAGASQLASVASLIAGYASVVAQPMLIPGARRGQMPRLLAESAAFAAIAGGVLLTVVWLFGDVVMRGVFGTAFEAAWPLLRVLTAGTCIDLLCMPVAMMFVLQLRPRLALLGELVIAVAYLTMAWPVSDFGPAAMAWLVTGVRAAKGLLYLGVTVYLVTRRLSGPKLIGTIAD